MSNFLHPSRHSTSPPHLDSQGQNPPSSNGSQHVPLTDLPFLHALAFEAKAAMAWAICCIWALQWRRFVASCRNFRTSCGQASSCIGFMPPQAPYSSQYQDSIQEADLCEAAGCGLSASFQVWGWLCPVLTSILGPEPQPRPEHPPQPHNREEQTAWGKILE